MRGRGRENESEQEGERDMHEECGDERRREPKRRDKKRGRNNHVEGNREYNYKRITCHCCYIFPTERNAGG